MALRLYGSTALQLYGSSLYTSTALQLYGWHSSRPLFYGCKALGFYKNEDPLSSNQFNTILQLTVLSCFASTIQFAF